jgi:hypothetical protein
VRLKKTGSGAPQPEYTHFDSQGSAVAATNPAGTVRFREQYKPLPRPSPPEIDPPDRFLARRATGSEALRPGTAR